MHIVFNVLQTVGDILLCVTITVAEERLVPECGQVICFVPGTVVLLVLWWWRYEVQQCGLYLGIHHYQCFAVT